MEVYTNRYNEYTKERKVIVVQVTLYNFVIGVAPALGFLSVVTSACMYAKSIA